MNTQATINQQIAGALGDAGGSYELLIGSHICDALGVEPTHRGLLVPAPNISSEAAAWLRQAAEESDLESEHAAEVLAVLQL